MKKYIPYLLSAWLLIGFTLFTSENAFSQSVQKTQMTTTDSLATANEGTSTVVKGVTAGRAKSLIGGVLGLMCLVIGWWSKARSSKKGAKVALALGLISIVLSVIHLSASAGAVFGSGSGKAGAIVALVLGLIGTILSGLALRSGKTN